MKTGHNLALEKVFENQNDENDTTLLRGVNTVSDEKEIWERYSRYQYRTAMLRNPYTKQRQYVLQITPEEIDGKLDKLDVATNGPIRLLLADEWPVEFKVDVRRAMAQFSKQQQTFLIDIFVRGLSIVAAAKVTRKSASHWKRWLTLLAIPALRESLKDYNKDGKLVLS